MNDSLNTRGGRNFSGSPFTEGQVSRSDTALFVAAWAIGSCAAIMAASGVSPLLGGIVVLSCSMTMWDCARRKGNGK